MRGILIVVSGPSGSGKSTLIRAALDALPDHLAYSVSATTREPREGEINGQDYIFLSWEEFERWAEEGQFLEWAEYSGNLYGTPEHRVEELLKSGLSVVLEIELQGARQVSHKRPDAVMIFVRAPSIEETRKRLADRATETDEALERRMQTAVEEVAASEEFDYKVVNSEVGDSIQEMVRILQELVQGEEDDKRPQDGRAARED